jgi:hypothetical protein
VKVLLIGEGRHDLGDPGPNPNDPRRAQGAIPTLARRVCEDISPESVALAWSEIRRFNPSAQKRGYSAKITAAALLAVRKFGCEATVIVTDRDGQTSRQSELEKGVDSARELFPQHPTAWGLAIESVEAWTLGVLDKIAEELGVDVKHVKQEYPAGVDVESLTERSGKPDHRPKQLLERIAQLKNRHDCTEFRQAIAQRTDVASLARACPKGFAPFAEQLRKALGQISGMRS